MANTKKLKTNRPMRKGVKRAQRRALKAVGATLTRAERRKLRKEPMGVRKFVKESRAAAATPAS